MHKNIIWQAFLLVILATCLWYSTIALYKYYTYSHLEAKTTVSSINWEIEEKSEENYLVKGIYSFEFRGHSFPGTSHMTDMIYRNKWAAEQAVKEFTQKKWKVWFDPQNPDHSSLQKNFPLKECITAIFLWGLLLYFLWLGFYVARFKT